MFLSDSKSTDVMSIPGNLYLVASLPWTYFPGRQAFWGDMVHAVDRAPGPDGEHKFPLSLTATM